METIQDIQRSLKFSSINRVVRKGEKQSPRYKPVTDWHIFAI
jgi:hypothetical protein